MEVLVTKEFGLGIEWSVFDDAEIDGETGVVGGSFGTSGGLNPSQFLYPNVPDGLSMGVIAGSVEIITSAGTFTVRNLGALIKAVETNEGAVFIFQSNNGNGKQFLPVLLQELPSTALATVKSSNAALLVSRGQFKSS